MKTAMELLHEKTNGEFDTIRGDLKTSILIAMHEFKNQTKVNHIPIEHLPNAICGLDRLKHEPVFDNEGMIICKHCGEAIKF